MKLPSLVIHRTIDFDLVWQGAFFSASSAESFASSALEFF